MCLTPAMDGMTHPKCRTRFSLDGLTCFFHYKGVVRKAIKSIKYRFVSDLCQEFINIVPLSPLQSVLNNFSCRQTDQQSAVLVPIPLHPSRLAYRGFNQAEALGKFIAQKLGIPIRSDILLRIKKTVPQVEVKERKKRLVNMHDVFSIRQSTIINCQSTIILFDDVCTTGATLRSAANVLKRAGAKSVWGVVMAHG
jgi:ComF family protein